MNRYFYDLHIHSCLSPCADNDNTPNNLVGMGVINGLNIMALTDHNTAKNCPAFYAAAKRNGIIPIAGMELTTAEDIHIVFLFSSLENAMLFDGYVETRRIMVKNRTDIYGEQLITDEQDNVIGIDEHLLSNATTITVDECPSLASRYDGICYPAHIDRDANGIIAVLGTVPKEIGFKCIELHNPDKLVELSDKHALKGYSSVSCSDAHYLWDVNEKTAFLDLDDEPYSGDLVRKRLLEKLNGGIL